MNCNRQNKLYAKARINISIGFTLISIKKGIKLWLLSVFLLTIMPAKRKKILVLYFPTDFYEIKDEAIFDGKHRLISMQDFFLTEDFKLAFST